MKLWQIIALSLLAMGLVGCETIGTTTLTSESTAEAIPVADVELSQTFSGQDMLGGTITVNYPERWAQGGDGNGVSLATNADYLTTSNTTNFESGVALAFIAAQPRSLAQQLTGEGADPSAESILRAFLPNAANAEDAPPFGDPQLGSINDLPIAYVRGTGDQDALILVVEHGDYFVILSGITAVGEMDDTIGTFNAIAAQVEYSLTGD